MYEDITYEVILERMLRRAEEVSPGIDTRPSSPVYTALAPAAVELQKAYIELDWVLDQMFADTAIRKYLVKRAAERGINPKPAAHAVLKGEFSLDIPIGSRFSLEQLDYKATERISQGTYRMQCETLGTIGNSQLGRLTPIGYIPGLERAELTELLIPGEDEEDTEMFRSRYFASLDSQAFGGNIADYREKVTAIPGVGGVKVYPAWEGGGTVKLVIINSEYAVPSTQLVQSVKDAIDPAPDEGKGYGLAPIGHLVTVEGAQAASISLTATITYQPDYSFERCRDGIYAAVDGYLRELNKAWQSSTQTVVRVSRIESRLLDVEGIMDVYDTKINGVSGNVGIPSSSITVRGDIGG